MSYLTANDRPGVHAASWYAETAGPETAYPALSGDTRADVCVIGGGFAGLSAALHLAERGASVKVLEANRVGWGASGRNGGQLGVGPRAEIEDYEKLAGPEDAAKVWEIAFEANRLVRDLIIRHQIDCDLANGYLACAWRQSDVAELHAEVDHLTERYGHPKLTAIDRDQMADLLGTTRYFGGFRDDQAGHLHPLRYARGLARAAATAGAEIHEDSHVVAVENGRVRTPIGTVAAPTILLACNGYLDGLSPKAQRRMMPINNYILATEPLGENRAKLLNPDNLCAADTRFVLNYFRLSPDKRMLWGGGESYGRKFPRDLKQFVRAKMLQVYPDLADVAITHAWGGTLAITGTRFPLFHDLGQGVRAIGGWSGSGIHMATMGGKIAADAIGGTTADWDVLARMPTPQFPGGDWFRMPLLRAAMFWYSLRDRL
ncbi:MAG: FAD-binding oxidoreductase [Pseudomonadota bacterium]